MAGIDWASEEHAVCVVDAEGRIVEGRRYRHDERGIGALCERLIELGVVLVALERPDGLLIERLLDAGLRVIAIHPNQVAAMRPRFSAAGGKSDGFDAFVLAELARTDSHRFRILVPDGDATKHDSSLRPTLTVAGGEVPWWSLTDGALTAQLPVATRGTSTDRREALVSCGPSARASDAGALPTTAGTREDDQ